MAQDIEAKISAGLQAGGAGLPDIALFQDFRIEQFLHDYPDAFVDLKAAGVDYSKFAAYKVGPMTVGKQGLRHPLRYRLDRPVAARGLSQGRRAQP